MTMLRSSCVAALLPLLVSLPACGEPFRVGRLLEFELQPNEWTVVEDGWQATRTSASTDGMHTYEDFLDVSADKQIERVWLEKVIVGASGVEGGSLVFSAVLPSGDTIRLAEGDVPANGELQLASSSADLLDTSGAFGTPSFEFRFDLVSENAPTISVEVSADFQSEATRSGR